MTEVTHLPQWLIIGFTGHRKLAQPDGVAESLRRAIDQIAMKHSRLAGVSSAASGSDTLFAEEMARRYCPFTIILPFPLERFRQDFNDDPDGWERVVMLLAKASEVEIIDELKTAQDSPAEAYMKAGHRTVDRSDVMIAVWDGRAPSGSGGTADAVAYARTIGKPILIISPNDGRIVVEGEYLDREKKIPII